MDQKKLKNIIEAVLLAAGKPLTLDQILSLFDDFERPEREALKEAITLLQNDFEDRGIELKIIASGYRLQVRPSLSLWVSRLWEDKPSRYSRAFLETLALIAYRQPITRGEIEAVRGVAVSSNIIRTMIERAWVKVVGQRDVPGKPALYATTKSFLDSFNLSSLSELPTLAEIRSLDDINTEIDFEGKQIKHNDPGLHENPQLDLLNIPMDSHTSALLSSEDGRLNVEEEDDSIPDFANANILKSPINALLFDESHIDQSDVDDVNELDETNIESVVLEAELDTESEMEKSDLEYATPS